MSTPLDWWVWTYPPRRRGEPLRRWQYRMRVSYGRWQGRLSGRAASAGRAA